jgi:hypothetical protein
MSKKKTDPAEQRTHYGANPDISVFYELKFGNKTIEPGDTLKFKEVRGTFKFIRLAHNVKKEVSWIECYSPTTGEYRFFYVDRLKSVVGAKRGARKKINVN